MECDPARCGKSIRIHGVRGNDHLAVQGPFRPVGHGGHLLEAHVQRMAGFFIHVQGNHVLQGAGPSC